LNAKTSLFFVIENSPKKKKKKTLLKVSFRFRFIFRNERTKKKVDERGKEELETKIKGEGIRKQILNKITLLSNDLEESITSWVV